MFNVSVSLEDNKILGKFIVDSYFFEPSKYDYAFYLCQSGKKIESKWYSKKMEAFFDLKDISGEVYIKVFVRDTEYGDKRTFDSEKMSINS